MANSIKSKVLYKEYENKSNLHFVPMNDIWDHAKILNFVNNCKIEKIEKLVKLVNKSFGKIEIKYVPRLSAPIPSDIEYFVGREKEILDIKKGLKM